MQNDTFAQSAVKKWVLGAEGGIVLSAAARLSEQLRN